MADNEAGITPKGDNDEKATRKARAEHFSRIMWAYVCSAIALLSFPVGLGPSFIPLGFGILGEILSWQLNQGGDRRHSVITGSLSLGGILIWFTYNWPTIRSYIGG